MFRIKTCQPTVTAVLEGDMGHQIVILSLKLNTRDRFTIEDKLKVSLEYVVKHYKAFSKTFYKETNLE